MQIPGAVIVDDRDGVEAQRFGAATSGQAFLYDRTGRLLFKRGITASRGHSCDNLGRNAVIDLINSGVASASSAPVFGCSLQNASDANGHRSGL